MIERICVVLYEMSQEGRKIFRDHLAAYAISNHLEIIIKWLLPTAKEAEIASACIEAQIAFVNAGDTARAAQIGRLVYQANPDCALVYYGHCLPQDVQELVAYFSRLFPARPVLYLDQPTRQMYDQTIRTLLERIAVQKCFIWETKGVRYRIPYACVLYFRSERNYVVIRLRDGTEYTFLGKLSNVERQLPPQLFVRVHQSYLVCKSAILLVDKQKKAVRLTNGEEILISKAHYKETLAI